MKFLSLKTLAMLAATLFSVTVWAGFQGINGNTSLGIFNKLTCSTGTTCTRIGDQFSIISSPVLTTGAFSILAPASTGATLDLQSDLNGSNGDDWQLKSVTGAGGFQLLNNTTGSQVAQISVLTSGATTFAGSVTTTGKLIPTGGIGSGSSLLTRFAAWFPSAVTDATSTTPSATTLYMTQVHVAHNFTITGVQVLNAATCGTNKWIVALFNSAGTVVANSATAGVLCSGASGFQSVAFTAPIAITGPETYWLGLYANGATDRFYAIPLAGAAVGLAGTVTGQTFGTVVNVTPPTTFTAGAGAVLATY